MRAKEVESFFFNLLCCILSARCKSFPGWSPFPTMWNVRLQGWTHRLDCTNGFLFTLPFRPPEDCLCGSSPWNDDRAEACHDFPGVFTLPRLSIIGLFTSINGPLRGSTRHLNQIAFVLSKIWVKKDQKVRIRDKSAYLRQKCAFVPLKHGEEEIAHNPFHT